MLRASESTAQRLRRRFRSARALLSLAAALLFLAPPHPAEAAEAAPEIVQEKCAKLRETKLQGPICKGFIQNDCTHAVDMTVRFRMTLRRVVILPVTAEGPSMEYQDAGTAEKEQQYRLEAGEGQWFVQKNEGQGIEVADCKMGFSYSYEE